MCEEEFKWQCFFSHKINLICLEDDVLFNECMDVVEVAVKNGGFSHQRIDAAGVHVVFTVS